MLQYLWLNKHMRFCNTRGSPVPLSQRGLQGEAGEKHFIKLRLLSRLLGSPFGSWKCQVLKVDRALPSASTVCPAGERAGVAGMWI